MECRVITVAVSTGAQAEEAGQQVAAYLRFRYVNNEIIAWAAAKAGVDPQSVDAVEHSTPLVTRMLDALRLAGAAEIAPWTPDLPLTDPSPAYRRLIQQVIRETAAEGRVVIVAHAAGILLAGMPDLLRVFVTASAEVRAARLAAEEGLDTREATRRIAHSDRERAAYLKRFYHLGQERPTHYDLVVNTDVLTPLAAAHLITCAAKS